MALRTATLSNQATAVWSLTWDVLHKTRNLGFFLIFYYMKIHLFCVVMGPHTMAHMWRLEADFLFF